MRPYRHLSALVVGLLASSQLGLVHAGECTVQFEEGQVRVPPMEMPVLGGFGTLVNPCGTPIVVIAASSPDFDEVQVHETRMEDGMMRMRHVESLTVAPGESVALAPGGLHLMLMRPVRPIAAGEEVEVTFTLADGSTVVGVLEVR